MAGKLFKADTKAKVEAKTAEEDEPEEDKELRRLLQPPPAKAGWSQSQVWLMALLLPVVLAVTLSFFRLHEAELFDPGCFFSLFLSRLPRELSRPVRGEA